MARKQTASSPSTPLGSERQRTALCQTRARESLAKRGQGRVGRTEDDEEGVAQRADEASEGVAGAAEAQRRERVVRVADDLGDAPRDCHHRKPARGDDDRAAAGDRIGGVLHDPGEGQAAEELQGHRWHRAPDDAQH